MMLCVVIVIFVVSVVIHYSARRSCAVLPAATSYYTSYYNRTEIDANIWIDASALTPYATTATLTSNYQTNSQLAMNYYNKGEVDGLIAGVSGGGGGVSNPIEIS